MLRTYKRKTERGRADHETIMTAVRKVVETGRPCWSVADEHDIPHCTLRRCYIRYRSRGGNRDMRTGYFNAQYVFTIDEKHLLVEYVQRAAALYYGLGTMEMRRLAYDYAKKLGGGGNAYILGLQQKSGGRLADRFLETAWEDCITDAESDVSSTCNEFQQGECRLVQRQTREVVPPRGIDAIENLES